MLVCYLCKNGFEIKLVKKLKITQHLEKYLTSKIKHSQMKFENDKMRTQNNENTEIKLFIEITLGIIYYYDRMKVLVIHLESLDVMIE